MRECLQHPADLFRCVLKKRPIGFTWSQNWTILTMQGAVKIHGNGTSLISQSDACQKALEDAQSQTTYPLTSKCPVVIPSEVCDTSADSIMVSVDSDIVTADEECVSPSPIPGPCVTADSSDVTADSGGHTTDEVCGEEPEPEVDSFTGDSTLFFGDATNPTGDMT